MYIFIHHCDLRVTDNSTLNLLEGLVQPIFIFTPQQIVHNEYKSDNAIQFMVQSLEELDENYKALGGRLQYYLGDTLEVLERLLIDKKGYIKGLAFNIDYSPFAIVRDRGVRELCKKYNIECVATEDKLLQPIDRVKTNAGTVYTKFTMYYNKSISYPIREPQSLPSNIEFNSNPSRITSSFSVQLKDIYKYYKPNTQVIVGGRKRALEILKTLKARHKDYDKVRNDPNIDTTRLGAYIKFGTISIREVYMVARGTNVELVRQLYWRDFFSMILYNFPSLSEKVSVTKPQLEGRIKWENDIEKYRRWCSGTTGCPIVDAGMRQMNTIGFMHNRVRMIVASFLVFYLKIDWRWGMKYFSNKLVDIDWANNVGGWQSVSATEKWSNDYYKIFSMDSQIKRFDPDCKYIKRWVPELKDVEPMDIIKWDTSNKRYDIPSYPKPIISNNKEARMRGLEMIKLALKIN
jgi:deoxyribodipyrimidine photo-lyase